MTFFHDLPSALHSLRQAARVAVALLLLATLALLPGCGRNVVSTDTGNPSINDTRIEVTATDTGLRVVGEAGAVSPGGAAVQVVNDTTDDSVTTTSASDGSFEVEIPGSIDDEIRVEGVAGPSELTGVSWVIRSVANTGTGVATSIHDGNFGQLDFEPSGAFTVRSPCNSGSGRYRLVGSTLSFSDVTFTEAACPDLPDADQFVQMLTTDGASAFTLENDELTLERGNEILQASRVPKGPGLDGREFLLASTTGETPLADTEFRLSFDDGNLSFSGGCNGHSGAYTLCNDALCVDGFSSTLIGCGEPREGQDSWLAEFLTSRPTIGVQGETLTLSNDGVSLVFTDSEFANPDRPLTGRVWTVDTLIMGEVASGGANLTATLEFKEGGAVEVFSGCNSGEGGYTVSGNTITLSSLAYTEAGCTDASYESHVEEVMSDGDVTFSIDANRLTIERGDVGLSATTE